MIPRPTFNPRLRVPAGSGTFNPATPRAWPPRSPHPLSWPLAMAQTSIYYKRLSSDHTANNNPHNSNNVRGQIHIKAQPTLGAALDTFPRQPVLHLTLRSQRRLPNLLSSSMSHHERACDAEEKTSAFVSWSMVTRQEGLPMALSGISAILYLRLPM